MASSANTRMPRGVHINVQEGERVKAGDPLMDGPRNPHDILAVLGEKELQKYLVNEIQEVYRLQGVNINDKHLEVIVAADDALGEGGRHRRHRIPAGRSGRQVQVPRGEPARGRSGRASGAGQDGAARHHQGVALDRFVHLGGVSFQETTRVLTEAAINGKVDYLRGLKENVIMGRLIPAGTGMEYYRQVKIAGEDVVEEPVAEPLDAIPGYDEETRVQYAGGLSEDTGGEETLAE